MSQTKHHRTKWHSDEMSQNKTPHRKNVTGQNATQSKCHRTKCRTDNNQGLLGTCERWQLTDWITKENGLETKVIGANWIMGYLTLILCNI